MLPKPFGHDVKGTTQLSDLVLRKNRNLYIKMALSDLASSPGQPSQRLSNRPRKIEAGADDEKPTYQNEEAIQPQNQLHSPSALLNDLSHLGPVSRA